MLAKVSVNPEDNIPASDEGAPSAQPAPPAALIDIRTPEQYDKSHARGSINFPARELILRSGELPPRTRPLVVFTSLSDTEATELAIAFFSRAKWVVSEFVTLGENGVLLHYGEKPHIAVGEQNHDGGRKGEGASTNHHNCWELISGGTAYGLRYWEPSPFVSQMLAAHLPKSGVAYDFGCGSGRDMAFLSGAGWTCVGIDNRAKLLSQAMAMSERFGTEAFGFVQGVQAHLEKNSSPFRPRSADLILMVRFLHRPSAMAMLGCVAVGGYFLCSHFVDGVQHSAVGTPKSPDAFLEHGELLKWLDEAEGSFCVLHDEETTIDDGRPVVNFLARRTA